MCAAHAGTLAALASGVQVDRFAHVLAGLAALLTLVAATGAARADPAVDSAVDSAPEPVRSRAKVLTSVTVTSTLLASASRLGGALPDLHCRHGEAGVCSFGGVFSGGYLRLGSSAVLSIGMPLWLADSHAPAPARDPGRAPLTLSLRATSGSVRLVF
jgi:hypothetical protein